MATFNLSLEQLYPAYDRFHLNTCGNADCANFGQTLKVWPFRLRGLKPTSEPRCPTAEALDDWMRHGRGAYKLSGADVRDRRTSKAFAFERDPHTWADQRTIKCQARLRSGTICGTGFSILSGSHLGEEIARLRNFNGVLDGPRCEACGTRYLAAPEEFSLNGVHQRTKDRNGNRIAAGGTPKSIRVLHRPCRGKRGARITISIAHVRQLACEELM
ncbi:hypothetical protein [Rhodobacter sp. CZR27]|uniref:hypothetical protein n=1 Tax=Rhodobacter sp. CZR27 TaxID=2033869 RepID=UPI0012FDBD78|nr:hypothetical protein [Rhodobacter sp. CZR27]